MSQGGIILCFIAGITLLMIVVSWIGNKVVDRTSDAVRNRDVRKHNQNCSAKEERLAERLERGKKL